MTGARAAFLDRDGVLNEGVPDPETGLLESPLHPDEVRLLPGVGEALARLADAGFVLVGVSNQPAVAKGKVSLEELIATQERVLELLAAEGVNFATFKLCLHHPEGIVPELSGSCECRKPAPGMLLEAAAELALDLGSSWMIGDTDGDVGAGRNAGTKTVLVEYPGSAHKRGRAEDPDLRAADLPAAVVAIVNG
ncbi:MAG: HAD-IIIA family hydrolase [Actinobacteria bacterium]|nr:HAD-IIIA family hydrolase [Actinomycetota bacterium]